MLAVLMPIVASMGGIAGSQVVTLMVRGLALGRVHDSNARWLLAKEIGVALLNGTIWAVVVALGTVAFFADLAGGRHHRRRPASSICWWPPWRALPCRWP